MNCWLRTPGHCLVRPSCLLSRAGGATACHKQCCLAADPAGKEHSSTFAISTCIAGRQELAAARPASPLCHTCHSLPVPADDFIQVWNQRKLPARYYTGLAAGAATMRRTGFQWGVRTGGAPQTYCGLRFRQQFPSKGLKGSTPLRRTCHHSLSLVPAQAIILRPRDCTQQPARQGTRSSSVVFCCLAGDAFDTSAVGMAAVMEVEREAQAARRAGQQVGTAVG